MDIDKLLDPMRAEIAKLNQECREIAQKSRSKKKKVRKMQMVAKKRKATLQPYGTYGRPVPDHEKSPHCEAYTRVSST